MYNSARAKKAANLRWLFAKAYGIDHIPEDMWDPFYTDQYEQEQIKPPVIRLLLSSELYCHVCGLILKGDQADSLQSHQSVIQALSRKGIYVMEGDDTPVTEGDLTCLPIKISSHMLMIDALMMVYTVEMISIEKVVTCVKHFSTFSASELPLDLEDAMIFWINKVRYRREHASGCQLPHFPLLEDLMRDVCDGAALLTVVHYYCPDLIKLDDICLKEVTSIGDRLYNIQLLKEFANEYLNKSFYLTVEDMLYLPLVLKHNVMVFIAELFWWFEIVKPDFVHPRDVQELKEARAVFQLKSSRPSVPISNATKRSFLVSPGMAISAHPAPNSPEVCNSNKGNYIFSPSHPLLPLRQRQQKLQQGEDASGCRNCSNSLMQESHSRVSVSWSEKRQRPLSQLNRYVLHCATDNNADLALGDSASLTCSISEDSLASAVMSKHQGLPSQSGPQQVNGHGLLGNINTDEDDTITVIQEDLSKNEVTLSNSGDVEHWCATTSPNSSSWGRQEETPADSRTTSFYLEPLIPAVLQPAKENCIYLNKKEVFEEERQRALARRGCAGDGPSSSARRRRPHHLNWTYASSISDLDLATVTSSVESSAEQSPGFYLYSSSAEDRMPVQVWGELSDGNIETVETIKDKGPEITKELHPSNTQFYADIQESTKCQEDMSVKEHEDKDEGCSSPALSVLSKVSMASGSVKMTTFAELKRMKMEKQKKSPTQQGKDNSNMLLLQHLELHLQLKEKHHAIETQKMKMEILHARQWLKLGKAAFFHVVKKGKSDTLPQSFKLDHLKNGKKLNGKKEQSSKTDSYLDAVRDREKGTEEPEKASIECGSAAAISPSALDIDEELDLNERKCSINSIQQQMMQLSFQQDLLMRQNIQSSLDGAQHPVDDRGNLHEPKVQAFIHFVEPSGSPVIYKLPKLTSTQSHSKHSELKLSKDHSKSQKISTPTPTDSPSPIASPGGRNPKVKPETINQTKANKLTNTTFHLHEEPDLCTVSREPSSFALGVTFQEGVPRTLKIPEEYFGPGFQDSSKNKASLLEVDLSNMTHSDKASSNALEVSTDAVDGEKKTCMSFFFKDEPKAEDEMAKTHAAFVLKQQKAEEARLRKQRLQSESELKRDKASRKAEKDWIRKEEEKASLELKQQEFLKRKQQELSEEQEQLKTKPNPKPKKQRPKSVMKKELSMDTVPKCNPANENQFSGQSGSNHSLVSVATTEADSVNLGGAGSQRGKSVELFSVFSRTKECDWDNDSTVSSITSTYMVEYTKFRPKLFKEPSTKSNKTIIHNAISHCCLAGKVNEPQKNFILEEIEKCKSNHLMILFRDGGCQFRALYSYLPDTEEIHKLTGTGPKTITMKMIDKLYKYSSDHKQFTVIPAKTVSVSVDALTIHNHLWKAKRSAVPKRVQSEAFG